MQLRNVLYDDDGWARYVFSLDQPLTSQACLTLMRALLADEVRREHPYRPLVMCGEQDVTEQVRGAGYDPLVADLELPVGEECQIVGRSRSTDDLLTVTITPGDTAFELYALGGSVSSQKEHAFDHLIEQLKAALEDPEA